MAGSFKTAEDGSQKVTHFKTFAKRVQRLNLRYMVPVNEASWVLSDPQTAKMAQPVKDQPSSCPPPFSHLVLKEVKFGSFLPLLADGPERRPLLVFLWGILKESQIVHFWPWSWKNLTNGLERTQIYLSASAVAVCHQYLVNGLERSYWSWYFHCFLWLIWTWRHSCITHEWDLTQHSLGIQQWFLCESWSLRHKNMVLKWLFWVVLKFQFDVAMIYQPPVIITFKVDLGFFQESCCRVAMLIQCMRNHGPERM